MSVLFRSSTLPQVMNRKKALLLVSPQIRADLVCNEVVFT